MKHHPLVSCLSPTLAAPHRFAALQASLADYCRQTYAPRELVLVVNSGDIAARDAVAASVAALKRDDIRMVDTPDDATLGALRNIAIREARGEIIAQWDDDDRHHPSRLARQAGTLMEAGCEAVLLQEVMQFFERTRLMFCTNWHATEMQSLPGTLTCWRSRAVLYPECGAQARLGEDSYVLRQMLARGDVRFLNGEPHLYVYVSHGRNSWPDGHHEMLASRLAISRGLLLRREAQLREGLAVFDFGPGAVIVQGSNGPAFLL
jgi:glycosyltransferase involved in cell wall biosynthesis